MTPSRVHAISMSQSTSREWLVAMRCSRRSSIHFTGRPTWRAANEIRKSRIELAADPEAAADVGLDHVDGSLGEPQHGGEHPTIEQQDFRCAENGEPGFGRIPFGDQARVSSGNPVRR